MEEQARRLLAGQDSHSCTYAEVTMSFYLS